MQTIPATVITKWQELAWLSEPNLARVDIAIANLACAEGLPGADWIDYGRCREWLAHSATYVRCFTERVMPQFLRRPWDYESSEAYFRVLCMVTALQRDLGLRYNPAKIADDARLDTADAFIHGAIYGDGGTCATIPVIYAAVGRRLGYPIRLVQAPHHLLARWDDPGGERFNIEATAKGLTCPPDDDYRNGRYSLTPAQERESRFLRSQTPREELAGFLAQRGYRWLDLRKFKESAESFIYAAILAPDHKLHGSCVLSILKKWHAKLRGELPGHFPNVVVRFPPRRWPSIPLSVEREFICWQAIEDCLHNPNARPDWLEAQSHTLGRKPFNLPDCLELVVSN